MTNWALTWRCAICGACHPNTVRECPHASVRLLGYHSSDTLECQSRGCKAQARIGVYRAGGERLKAFCEGHDSAARRLVASMLREEEIRPEEKR